MRIAVVGFLALALTGCGDDEPGKDKTRPGTDTDAGVDTDDTDTDPITDDTDTTNSPSFENLDCALAITAPQVLQCTWTSSEPGRAYVVTDLDGAMDTTPYGPSGTDHAVSVLGLKMGKTYTYRAVLETDAGDVVESEERTVEIATTAWAPDITVTGSATHPYVLTTFITQTNSYPLIFDADGDIVWHHAPDTGSLVTTVRTSLDGQSVLFARWDLEQKTDIGRMFRVPMDGSPLTDTRTLLIHHAFLEHADGDISWLSYEYRTIDPDEWVSDVIRRTPEGTQAEDDYEVMFSWFDDYGHDPWVDDELQDNFALGDADFEWTHSNSLMQIDDDHYYLLTKFLDCVLKVDLDGNVVWQLGGLYSDFTNPDGSEVWREPYDTDLFSRAHMSHLWDGGMLVFDNNYTSTSNGHSRIVEYAWDETTWTVEEVWAYDEPEGGFTRLMGDARKLDNGNYLTGWSSLKYFAEINPKGEEVWRADFVGAKPARLLPIDDLYDLH